MRTGVRAATLLVVTDGLAILAGWLIFVAMLLTLGVFLSRRAR